MELFKASQQWATRPQDERFHTIEAGYQAALGYARNAVEKTDVNPATLRAQAVGEDVQLVGRGAVPAVLTHWSFGQLARYAEAPAGYLRKLPATLAAQNLNHGLAKAFGSANEPKDADAKVNLLVHSNGHLLVRALTSERYARIWNYELLEQMRDFSQYGWANPVPFQHMTKADGSDAQGKAAPTIYVSDHDMFVFQVNNENRISEPGNPGGLGRGFFVENSEVGSASFRVTFFLYRYMCCNHIIWGAQDVKEIAIRHVGSARDRVLSQFDALTVTLKEYANESVSDLEARIKTARNFIIPATGKDKLLDAIFSKLKGQVSRKALDASYTMALANESTDGRADSIWGFAQGMTRYSQTIPYADERVALDRAAGKLVEMAF